MTSPALVVLFLAHVCSIFGTASQPTADHDRKLTIINKNMKPKHGAHTHPNLWTNNHRNYDESNSELYVNNNKTHDNNYKEYDDLYTEYSENAGDLDLHNKNITISNVHDRIRKIEETGMVVKKRLKRDPNVKRRSKRDEGERCEAFYFNPNENRITHPHPRNSKNYYNNTDCVTIINGTAGQVIVLTFVDEFRIEYHPDCAYDYLEIRDGARGYAKLLDKVCGQAFPQQMQTSGPHAWLKFHSDDTIEYEGFHINIAYKDASSHSIPESCTHYLGEKYGDLDLKTVNPDCTKGSMNQKLDVLWIITVPEGWKIYLNFTTFRLANPNECEINVVEVFGSDPQVDTRLAQYCGSIANPVSTKDTPNEKSNIMHVRLALTQSAVAGTLFAATYTAYRTLNPTNDKDKCIDGEEFDCDDNTCIDIALLCNHVANCRLKTDEDLDHCKTNPQSSITQPHILVILVIFSLILSAMSFVFLYKCIRKLYQDHKIIKEHIRQSCEDRLDSLVGSRLTLDAKRLQRDSEPRASLERQNHANEMFKRKRESFSKRKPTSIDSDYIQETQVDIEEEIWSREVDVMPTITDEVPIERNGRTRRSDRRSERRSERRSDTSKKEEAIKRKESEDKKEIRDVSVGTPDTKESGCQTRESLFQADAPVSSDGSGSNSRGFSTFGYSGATIVRPSPPATKTSEVTIELLQQVPRQDSVKPQKKTADRRPMSTETTRSAPDVIIVSKPIR